MFFQHSTALLLLVLVAVIMEMLFRKQLVKMLFVNFSPKGEAWAGSCRSELMPTVVK